MPSRPPFARPCVQMGTVINPSLKSRVVVGNTRDIALTTRATISATTATVQPQIPDRLTANRRLWRKRWHPPYHGPDRAETVSASAAASWSWDCHGPVSDEVRRDLSLRHDHRRHSRTSSRSRCWTCLSVTCQTLRSTLRRVRCRRRPVARRGHPAAIVRFPNSVWNVTRTPMNTEGVQRY